MRLNAYAIYDVKAAMYQRPFFAVRDGEATRAFVDAVATKDHPLGQHPEDYTLFRIGAFNDESGLLEASPAERMMTALEAAAQMLTNGEVPHTPKLPGLGTETPTE